MNFNENLSKVCQVVPCEGQTDRQTDRQKDRHAELVVNFRKSRTRLKALDTILNLCYDTLSQSISCCLVCDIITIYIKLFMTLLLQYISCSLGC